MLASRQRPPEWTWGRIKGVSMQRSTTNGMGLAGFILSLVGLFSAGCLSPIALVFSLIGLAKEPRGFAIAGLVISLVSLLGWVIGFAIFGVAFVGLLAGAVGLAALAGPVQAEFDVITDQLNARYAETGSYPATLSELPLARETLQNAGGEDYLYTPTVMGFELRDVGLDGQEGTDDDAVLLFTRRPGGGWDESFESLFFDSSSSSDVGP
jgi:hypothetical protein